jgi:hypothetical protein
MLIKSTAQIEELEQRQQIEKWQGQIQSLQKQLDLLDMISQVLPWGGLNSRLSKLQSQIYSIEFQIRKAQLSSYKKSIPLRFPRFRVCTAWVPPQTLKQRGA